MLIATICMMAILLAALAFATYVHLRFDEIEGRITSIENADHAARFIAEEAHHDQH